MRTPLPPAYSHWFVQPWCTKATTAYSTQNVRLAPGARSDIHVMPARHRHHTGGSMVIALPPNCRQRLRLNLRPTITTTQLNRFVAPTAYWGLPSKAALTGTAIYSPPQNGPLGNQNRPKRHAERPIRQHQTAQKSNRLAANRLREASTAKHKTGKQAWKYSPGTNRKTMETTVKQQHIVDDRATPTCRD